MIKRRIYEKVKFCYFRYIFRRYRKKKARFLFDLSDSRIGIGNIISVTPAIIAVKALCPDSLIDVKLKYKELLQGREIINDLYDEDSPHRDNEYDFIFTHELGKESRTINSLKLDVAVDKNETRNHFEKIKLIGYMGEMPGLYVSIKSVDIPLPKDRLKIGIINCGKNENFGLNGESKSWPYYNELIRILLEDFRCRIYLIGGPYEKWKIKTAGEDIIDCIGKYTLPETAYILKNCDVIIGNDCGPMRIADAVGVRHYVIWGPTSPVKNGYLNNYFDIYNEKIACRPCQGKNKTEKCSHLECLYGIKPADVISVIEELKEWKK